MEYSLPQALPYGVNAAYVIGQNSEGILVHLAGRSHRSVHCYHAQSLALKWKKDIVISDKNALVEAAYLSGDSIVVFYSHFIRGHHVLKANLYSPAMNLLRNAVPVDTSSALLGETSSYRFTASTLRSHFMVFTGSNDFARKREIRYVTLDADMNVKGSGRISASQLQQPDLLSGHVTEQGEAWFVCGDGRARNFNNTYLYTTVGLFSSARFVSIAQEGRLLSEPLFRFDAANGAWVIGGLFSSRPGHEAHGIFFMRGGLHDTIAAARSFVAFSDEVIAIASSQSKRGNAFRDHLPTDMVVRRDGGVLLITEAQAEYSETVSSGRFNSVGPGMVSNQFFFNDLVVLATDSSGALQWSQVLRKKQQSDNDGGYYLSYGMLVGPRQLWLVYNDRLSGENNLSAYAVSGTGEQKRTALVSTDRKSLAPVPSQARQIAANVLVLPSLRKGFFQLIKITFPA